MSEGAKIGLTDEAIAIIWCVLEGWVKKVSVKIRELDSDNSDVYSASSVESDPGWPQIWTAARLTWFVRSLHIFLKSYFKNAL